MNKIIILIIAGLFATSCTPAGTLEKVNVPDLMVNGTKIDNTVEVYRYFIEDGNSVYVSRFKTQPQVQTITYSKGVWSVGNIVIHSDDSIQVFHKVRE